MGYHRSFLAFDDWQCHLTKLSQHSAKWAYHSLLQYKPARVHISHCGQRGTADYDWDLISYPDDQRAGPVRSLKRRRNFWWKWLKARPGTTMNFKVRSAASCAVPVSGALTLYRPLYNGLQYMRAKAKAVLLWDLHTHSVRILHLLHFWWRVLNSQ